LVHDCGHAGGELAARRACGGVITNIEVFFDLVYAFAVTQLSHYLLEHATIEGALQTALLLAMVWVLWASTAYLANYRELWPSAPRQWFGAQGSTRRSA